MVFELTRKIVASRFVPMFEGEGRYISPVTSCYTHGFETEMHLVIQIHGHNYKKLYQLWCKIATSTLQIRTMLFYTPIIRSSTIKKPITLKLAKVSFKNQTAKILKKNSIWTTSINLFAGFLTNWTLQWDNSHFLQLPQRFLPNPPRRSPRSVPPSLTLYWRKSWYIDSTCC